MKKTTKLLCASFVFLLGLSTQCSADSSLDSNSALSQKEVALVDNGILKEALKSKDYDTVSTMAISYFNTSNSPFYKGDKLKLRKKSIGLLIICHNAKHITSSLFLVRSLMPVYPKQAKQIAREAIVLNGRDPKKSSTVIYKNIVMLYVSMVLDNKELDIDETNIALEAMDSLREETPQTKFFSAFLFKRLGSEDMANMYLTEACKSAKPKTNIYAYCYDDNNVEVHEPIDELIINKDCKKDIGKRCK